MPHRNDTARQKEKKIREAINPFLSVAQQVAQAQLDDGHDFLLETPLTKEVLRHPTVAALTDKHDVHVVNKDMWPDGITNRSGQLIKRSTWWLTSSSDIAKHLDRPCKANHLH